MLINGFLIGSVEIINPVGNDTEKLSRVEVASIPKLPSA
jgi:hypothetical protein